MSNLRVHPKLPREIEEEESALREREGADVVLGPWSVVVIGVVYARGYQARLAKMTGLSSEAAIKAAHARRLQDGTGAKNALVTVEFTITKEVLLEIPGLLQSRQARSSSDL